MSAMDVLLIAVSVLLSILLVALITYALWLADKEAQKEREREKIRQSYEEASKIHFDGFSRFELNRITARLLRNDKKRTRQMKYRRWA